MINRVYEILREAKTDGKNINLGSNDYKELVILLNPIAREFVSMIAESGNIKSDVVKIKGDKFIGLRATILFDEGELKRSKVEYILDKLEISPSLVIINEYDADLFFTSNKPINLVSEDDYINLVFSFIDFVKQNENMGLKFIGWNLEEIEMIRCNELEERNTVFSKDLFDQSICRIEYIEESLIGA